MNRTRPVPLQKSRTPEDVHITPRKVAPEFSKAPKRWLSDPFKLSFMNAMSVFVPMSERYLIDVMRDCLPGITDDKLCKDVRDLIRQEGMHAHLHRKANALIEHHYPGVRWFQKIQDLTYKAIRKLNSRAFEIATPALFEHFTSALSLDVLENQQYWIGDADNPATRFLVWHALEEVEHKAVCYDVYRACFSGRWRLVLMMLLFWVPLTLVSVYSLQLYFLHRDRVIYKPSTWPAYFRFLLRSSGLFTSGILRYLDRDYEPWKPSEKLVYSEHVREGALIS